MDSVGTFRTTILIESAERRGVSRAVDNALVDTGSDMIILGARALERMNLRVDALKKQLLPAGPILAGAA
jgi:predicted aspartyl protease